MKSADELQIKIAHLQMLQGVISRMASDLNALRALAVTVAAGVIALAQVEVSGSPNLFLFCLIPIAIFWFLAAYTLHVERSYRQLYDKVRGDGRVDPLSMDWRTCSSEVKCWQELLFTPSILLPFIAAAALIALSALTVAG